MNATELRQEEVNEIIAGMEAVWAKEARELDARTPVCHFSKMQFHMAEEGQSWWECRHCSHSKEV